MSITVVKAGILDTIQDKGRYGYQHLGINPGGAMDVYSMQVANALVGNPLDEAVIEMHFPAAVFLFDQPVLIALAGADLQPAINGTSVPMLHPIIVGKHDVLQFVKPRSGTRSYLAIQGGLVLETWLNSYSTNLKANCGGFHGRSLQKEDVFGTRTLYSPFTGHKILPWKADISFESQPDHHTRILPGHEWSNLEAAQIDKLLNGEFILDKHSDRMGFRLSGEPIRMKDHSELISSAVGFGTIQLLPDGMPIILMADHQTTGGYPRIAHVITADHSKLAQTQAGEKIRFRLVDQRTAEELYIEQQQHLLQLQRGSKLRLEGYDN